jgi:hypothetical protein
VSLSPGVEKLKFNWKNGENHAEEGEKEEENGNST